MNQRDPKLCKYVITNVSTHKFEWGCNNIKDLDDHNLCKVHRELYENLPDKDKGICLDCGVVITHCRLSRQQYYIPSLCEECYNETT